jgi:hypothetical protein
MGVIEGKQPERYWRSSRIGHKPRKRDECWRDSLKPKNERQRTKNAEVSGGEKGTSNARAIR